MPDGFSVRIEMDNVRATVRAFRELDRNASKELRDESVEIAQDLAVKMKAAANADGAQSALVAPTVRARRDRVPVVVAGGAKRVGRHGKPAGSLIFSSEFGQSSRSGWYARRRYGESRGRQWHPHRGAASYWFFKTFEDEQPEMFRRWANAVDRLLRKWGAGG